MTAPRYFAPVIVALLLIGGCASTDKYMDTESMFRAADHSAEFFDQCYGYALFPTIGKVAFGIGAATGEGRVYAEGKHVGDAKLTQLSFGYQIGMEGYSEVVFFQDERAFDEFTSGEFEFGANAALVFREGGAQGSAATTGATGSIGSEEQTSMAGHYHKGMAVFLITKGGFMVELSASGQKFSYKPVEE